MDHHSKRSHIIFCLPFPHNLPSSLIMPTTPTTTTTTTTTATTMILQTQSRKSCFKQPQLSDDDDDENTLSKKQRRRVVWCESVRVTTIPSIYDFCDPSSSPTSSETVQDYIGTLWYNRQEFTYFQNCDKALLCLIQKHQQQDEAAESDTVEMAHLLLACSSSSESDKDELGLCVRGLEHRTKAGSKLKMQNRIAVYDAVLDEQESQWEVHQYDPELIAHMYTMHARSAKDMAHQRALGDADYVNQYVRTPMMMTMMTMRMNNKMMMNNNMMTNEPPLTETMPSAEQLCNKSPQVERQKLVLQHHHSPVLRRRSLISSAA
jgi:hypothetical protein